MTPIRMATVRPGWHTTYASMNHDTHENHDLFLFGIPDTHYEPVGEDRMDRLVH